MPKGEGESVLASDACDAIRREIQLYRLRGLEVSTVFLHPDERLPYFEPPPGYSLTQEEVVWGKPIIRSRHVKLGSAVVHVGGFKKVDWASNA